MNGDVFKNHTIRPSSVSFVITNSDGVREVYEWQFIHLPLGQPSLNTMRDLRKSRLSDFYRWGVFKEEICTTKNYSSARCCGNIYIFFTTSWLMKFEWPKKKNWFYSVSNILPNHVSMSRLTKATCMEHKLINIREVFVISFSPLIDYTQNNSNRKYYTCEN